MRGEYRNPVDDSFEKIEDDVKKVLGILTSTKDSDDITEIKDDVEECILQLDKLVEKL